MSRANECLSLAECIDSREGIVTDLLREFSSVYAITDCERMIGAEVSKRARELDVQPGINLFPENGS